MPIYAFVSAPVSNPDIVLDLDDDSPLRVVDGTKTAPPTRRISSFGSTARDGDVISQDSYNDRHITIGLDFVPRSTAEQQSEAIQKLARLLNGEQWLQWQHDAKIAPVFYRTKFGDIDIVDDVVDDMPTRTITLDITAEPFAYGEAVTGSGTIANDPTAATNPMSFAFPDIQGDVTTPLSLTLNPATGVTNRFMLGTSAGGSTPTTPFRAQPAAGTTATGWTLTAGFADTDSIGGTVSRAVKASGALTISSSVSKTLPPGDWRALFRARTTVAGATITVKHASAANDRVLQLVSGSGYYWYDAGVFRLPLVGYRGDAPPGIVPVTSGNSVLGITLAIAGTAGEIRMDDVLYVPAGLDDATLTRLMLCGELTFPSSSPFPMQIDSLAENVWQEQGISGLSMARVAGGLPAVCPGVSNVLTFVPDVAQTTFDVLTATTVINYFYYPRYLYDRPASS